MNTDVHCHECGAITRVVREDDGFEMLVCTNDNCPVIGVGQLSRPSELAIADAFTPPDPFSRKV